jgi:hypothetical protein
MITASGSNPQYNAIKAETDLITTQGFTSRLTPTTNRGNATGQTITIDIQPPAGQTWVIYVGGGCQPGAAGDVFQIGYYDGVNFDLVNSNTNAGGIIGGFAILRITHTLYCRLSLTVTGGPRPYSYGYFGYKE